MKAVKTCMFHLCTGMFIALFSMHCALIDMQGSRNWGNTVSSNGNTVNSSASGNSGKTHRASAVYGQYTSFTCGIKNNNGSCTTSTANAQNLSAPIAAAPDSTGGLYVADAGNNRVLYFPSGSTTASRVYGQSGNFSCNVKNNNSSCIVGSPTANNLYAPSSAVPDSSGGLFIADTGNNRVLYYSAGSTTASRVYGQFGSFTCNVSVNNGSCAFGTPSANNLYGPNSAMPDMAGGLYISDVGHNRVLYYSPGATTASRVYGQYGSFTCGVATNNGSCVQGMSSANTLYEPSWAAPDSSGGLYITDYFNCRVLYYSAGNTVASRVYGQLNNFTTLSYCGFTSANSLSYPTAATPDSSGGFYIADKGENRVLYYTSGGTTAIGVYGQMGSFTCDSSANNGSCQNGTPSPENLSEPSSVVPDNNGGLYIVDYGNNRVLYFAPGS